MLRTATAQRSTNETKIMLELNLDGTGEHDIFTDIGFFDHMLSQFSKHSFVNLHINVEGDTDIDCHHSIEDVGIVLGGAFKEALGDKKGIRRYGSALLPMDDALVSCAVDFSGRPYLVFDAAFTNSRLGGMDTEMVEEFFKAVSNTAGMNIHITCHHGKNNHHIAEAIFKAFAKAVAEAVSIDPRCVGIPSTKGTLEGVAEMEESEFWSETE